MTKRKHLSKGLRFDIFRRDRFTCQYCGLQPPTAVLEIDHVLPVVEGGTNEILNLVTACQDCNRGKGKKLLDEPIRHDADLAWLETQQEIAELRRYQEAKQAKETLLVSVIESLQNTWADWSGLGWVPADRVLRHMLAKHGPEIVEEALSVVAIKVADGLIKDWVPYTWGVLRQMKERADNAV